MTPPDEALHPITRIVSHTSRTSLRERYFSVRADTERLAAPLSAEDQALQSMPDASPAKWHRAHTTWFFETFVLRRFAPRYRVFDDAFAYLFNSYYEAVGPRHPRPDRGAITRPDTHEIALYRRHVDDGMVDFLSASAAADDPDIMAVIELGLQHEQQHQELLLTDILHAFAQSPLGPAYGPFVPAIVRERAAMEFMGFAGGVVEIGHASESFAFDNEGPRHRVFLDDYLLATRPVTNGEWLEFMAAGGYSDAKHWLSDGWQTVRREGWHAPLYWREVDGTWHTMTLAGLQPLDDHAPVTHVSFYEADAFARWRGARLPTEAEWENAARNIAAAGNLRDSGYLRPLAAAPVPGLQQVFGDVWEWTRSAYAPYPGYRAPDGVIGEYNGKFMCNQMVLRGGSCITPDDHIRASYRNFFYPHQRWQFAGVRLANDACGRARGTRVVDEAFLHDVVDGLAKEQKRLPCKYFYDREGSLLFDAICSLPEYYLTRTETELLRDAAPEVDAIVQKRAVLVEFGSGSSTKTRILLDALSSLAAYAPVDISGEHLFASAQRIAAAYRHLTVVPVAADFTRPFSLPGQVSKLPRIGFFPGSTIGNFSRAEAQHLLRSARAILGGDAMFVIGIDLLKEAGTLIAAYDDSAGVTAAFNKNILVRINRELGADIDLGTFDHRAVWNAAEERIEMHLVSRAKQSISIADTTFDFARGETIHTENSHKYRLEDFSALAADAGWRVVRAWVSASPAFAVLLLG